MSITLHYQFHMIELARLLLVQCEGLPEIRSTYNANSWGTYSLGLHSYVPNDAHSELNCQEIETLQVSSDGWIAAWPLHQPVLVRMSYGGDILAYLLIDADADAISVLAGQMIVHAHASELVHPF